ncbi:sortase [Candidatus Saccharibacteria bacterium]|nr:sortase [Candidatus Saccharibacteria bacterium]
MKRILIIMFASIMGILSNPEILTASDDVMIRGLDETNIVNTVPESVAKTTGVVGEFVMPAMIEDANVALASVVTYETSTYTHTYSVQETTPVYEVPAPVIKANNIQITGRTLEIMDVNSTLVDAGNHVNKYGEKFLYGHNTTGVFADLPSLGIGGTFTVTYNGKITTYKVQKTVVFEKNAANGLLQINGSGNYMNAVSKARFDGAKYDLSLMTCYGTNLGGGEATHRFVVFANVI